MTRGILQGGLGNYMFQVAATYAHSVENDTEPVFCFEDAFQAQNHIGTYSDNIFSKLTVDCTRRGSLYYKEPYFHYSKIPMGDDLVINGYFQSEKYFAMHRSSILDLFGPTKKIEAYINSKYGNLLDGDTCSIHVRRGDYLSLSENHPVLDIGYYRSAMKKLYNPKFLIFSDDIQWCRENFKGPSFTFIQEKDYIDLYIMSMCKDNIIANSSFSWWGAWLNNNPHKKVIAPKTWFGPALNHNLMDLRPKTWNLI
tara:strand:- start:10427 stop:11188 length:762 start_codon:yes stop_codon:yes gene_type:complete